MGTLAHIRNRQILSLYPIMMCPRRRPRPILRLPMKSKPFISERRAQMISLWEITDFEPDVRPSDSGPTQISLLPLRAVNDDIQYQISLLEPWPTTFQSKIVDAQACYHCMPVKPVKRMAYLTVPTASPLKFSMSADQVPVTDWFSLPEAQVTVDQYYGEAF